MLTREPINGGGTREENGCHHGVNCAPWVTTSLQSATRTPNAFTYCKETGMICIVL